MSRHVSLWVYLVWDYLCLLDLTDYFLYHVGEIFNYNLFKNFLKPFFISFSSGTPILRMLVHLILMQRSLRLSSVLFFLFTLFCSSEVISTFLSSSLLIRSSASDILLLIPSVQFSRSVVSDSLWPHEPKHTRPTCPSPTPRAHPNSCPSSQWCHPTISSSIVPFSSCPQSFAASGYFQMSQLFASGGQGTEVSGSASVFPMNIQDWFPLGWTGWISLKSKGLSRVFSNTTVQKHQFFSTQLSLSSNSHIHSWLLEKP